MPWIYTKPMARVGNNNGCLVMSNEIGLLGFLVGYFYLLNLSKV
ncbi:MAG: hypothetical protein ACFE9N_01720 [Promethearchaeota archaeon]